MSGAPARLACSFCGSTTDVDVLSGGAYCGCGKCQKLPAAVRAGVGVYCNAAERKYYVKTVKHRTEHEFTQTSFPSYTEKFVLDLHGVCDLFSAGELAAYVAECGFTPAQFVILSYVKPARSMHAAVLTSLQEFAALGFTTWISFVKDDRPVLGTKGHFMSLTGASVLIDDSVEHVKAAEAFKKRAVLVTGAAEVKAAIAALRLPAGAASRPTK